MSSSQKPKNQTSLIGQFKHDDSFAQEVPTITSLLKRKKVTSSSSSEKPSATPGRAQPEQDDQLEGLVLETNQLRTNATRSSATRRGILQNPALHPQDARDPQENTEELEARGDPSGAGSHSRAAWALIENGASGLLWLKHQPDSPNGSLWGAFQAWAPRELLSLWNGFMWNPALHAGPWATLQGNGFYEISPNLKGDWSSVRRAFGAQATDYLSFFRTGRMSASS